jgi:hypothetical protein
MVFEAVRKEISNIHFFISLGRLSQRLRQEEQRVDGFASLDRAIAGSRSGLIDEEGGEPLRPRHVIF